MELQLLFNKKYNVVEMDSNINEEYLIIKLNLINNRKIHYYKHIYSLRVKQNIVFLKKL